MLWLFCELIFLRCELIRLGWSNAEPCDWICFGLLILIQWLHEFGEFCDCSLLEMQLLHDSVKFLLHIWNVINLWYDMLSVHSSVWLWSCFRQLCVKFRFPSGTFRNSGQKTPWEIAVNRPLVTLCAVGRWGYELALTHGSASLPFRNSLAKLCVAYVHNLLPLYYLLFCISDASCIYMILNISVVNALLLL